MSFSIIVISVGCNLVKKGMNASRPVCKKLKFLTLFPGKILCDLAAFKIAKIFFQQISGKHDVKKGISYLVWHLWQFHVRNVGKKHATFCLVIFVKMYRDYWQLPMFWLNYIN